MRYTRYEQRIIVQTNINRIAETVVIIVNAPITLGFTYNITTPPSRQIHENVSPFAGTARLESLANAFGATPSCARPNSIRLVEKTPLLAEDAAEVSTTKLITLAAAAIGGLIL